MKTLTVGLAAALTAYQTINAAGESLIDDTVLSAVFVLMVVTAILGPILTQGFAQRIEGYRPSSVGAAP